MNIPPVVYIILVNYNGYRDTLECIRSIHEGTYDNYNIVVVDNASTDNSVEILNRELTNKEQLIENNKNVGFGAGNNIGIKYALECDADYIILLNNDTIVPKNFLESMVCAMTHGHCEVMTCKIKYYGSENNWYAGGRIDWFRGCGIHVYDKNNEQRGVYTVDFICGCCLIATSQVFRQELLPIEYFMYFEDLDYSITLCNLGYQLYYNADICIYHKVSASVGIESAFFVKYWNRNRLIFFKKFKKNIGFKYPLVITWFYLTRIIKAVVYLAKQETPQIRSMWEGIKEGQRYNDRHKDF